MKIHIIQKGETLTDIAVKYELELESIISSNPQIAAPDAVVPGMKLMIPQDSTKNTEKEKAWSKLKYKKRQSKEAHRTEETIRRPMGIALHDDGLTGKSQQDSVRIFLPQDRPFKEFAHTHNINKTATPHCPTHDAQKNHSYCDCCHRPMYF